MGHHRQLHFRFLYPSLPGARLVLNSGISEQFTTPAPDYHYGFYLPDAPQHLLSAVPRAITGISARRIPPFPAMARIPFTLPLPPIRPAR
ncbi:MAG: hypothetical protein H6559_03935 [Lewinellaceae bacterium]|nr:hypothetical protein [Lewinellaceae bacterium]